MDNKDLARKGFSDMEDFFEKGPGSTMEVDPEELVQQIDIDLINDEATRLAMEMVNNLSDVYFDEAFMRENPSLKKRIDFGIESMRVLIKMRKSSERTHDILLNSIAANANNASLYLAQARIEGNLLNIQKQIDDTINALNNLLKGYQLEINFSQQQQQVDEDTGEILEPTNSVHRGSKTFIQQMREKNASTGQTEIDFAGDNDSDTLE